MKVCVAIDSFKGSLSSAKAGKAIKEGIMSVYPSAYVKVVPLADGGEGTIDACVTATNGEIVRARVRNPIGETITAEYGIISDKLAIIEMATASGLPLISEEYRNPMHTTSYGTGELIADALSKGCRRFIVGIGGSATNDGGVGMLQALGFEFSDENGKQVPFGAKGLEHIKEIKVQNRIKELDECDFLIACDVNNPLCGKKGCSAVFGPQKGADADMVEKMDVLLEKFAVATKEIFPNSDKDTPGAGAAGGLGFAFMSYLGGKLCSGIDLIIKEIGLEKEIVDAEIVITGEGRLDAQSCMGKAPTGVAKLAKKFGKTVVAFSGCVTDDAKKCNENGIDAYFPILKTPSTINEAMEETNAYTNLRDTAEQVFRLIKARE